MNVRTTRCEATVLSELPSPAFPGSIQYFAGGSIRPTPCDGLIVEFRPCDRPSWLGIFQFEYPDTSAPDQLITLPDPSTLVVIAGGRGYVVDCRDPAKALAIPAFPIMQIALTTDQKPVCAFVDPTAITVVESGEVWRTRRLSWDGVELVDVTSDRIVGRGWDAASDRRVEFQVNLDTRTVTGGPENFPSEQI